MGGNDETIYDLARLAEQKDEIEALLSEGSVIGGETRILQDTLRGPNILKGKRLPILNRDAFTQVFFTRPLLRLTYHNLIQNRKLAKLLVNNDTSIERYVRSLLDPRLAYGDILENAGASVTGELSGVGKAIKSKLIDETQPFIPVFSNTLTDLTGWPDVLMDTFTSKEGMRGEVTSWADGSTQILRSFDLDATFMNIIEEPIPLILSTWLEYQFMVKDGRAMPYFDILLRREIDYQTGIYVFILGEDHRNIKHIAKTIGYPTVDPTGKIFDYTKDGNKRTEMNSINCRFKCVGAEYDDPILMLEFNKHISRFNPGLRDFLGAKEKGTTAVSNNYIELPEDLYNAFSGVAIPYIDIRYSKLEWLVDKKYIRKVKKILEGNN